jgi:prepilin-type N-terminal cleavage/methylation domain-containing protein
MKTQFPISDFRFTSAKHYPRGCGVSRFTFHVSRITHHAFTLLELLVVISIIGLLAALATPVLKNFKPNIAASATRQLLDDVARARQLAISQRTTVYMIFVPTNFWAGTTATANWTAADWLKASNLFDKQLIGYTYVTLRSIGDQPGRGTTNYLGSWRTLPEGTFIPWLKWAPNNQFFNFTTGSPPALAFQVYGFNKTVNIPFPAADTPAGPQNKNRYVALPYIAFDYLGRLTDDAQHVLQQNAMIPLAKGSISFSRDPATKAASMGIPSLIEAPAGNSTNSFTVVNIDWLTGRPRVERVEVQ